MREGFTDAVYQHFNNDKQLPVWPVHLPVEREEWNADEWWGGFCFVFLHNTHNLQEKFHSTLRSLSYSVYTTILQSFVLFSLHLCALNLFLLLC